jgi:glycosyltransferase involved in cell wall biosynthesis
MEPPIRVLMVTTGWPQPGKPQTTHFIKRQAEFLRAHGATVEVFYFRGFRNPAAYLRAWIEVQQRLRRGHYDLVHAQWGQSAVTAIPKRLPLVVTFRGGDVHGIPDGKGGQRLLGHVLQAICRYVARRADAIIIVSDHMRSLLGRHDTPVHVIPSGIDFSLFRVIPRDEARRHLGVPADKRLILFAGNPASARKRHGLAQAAVDVLSRTLPAELVVTWGVSHDDMPYYMNACDAMVFTSNQEGSPNVVKEALACDLPVVSVRVGDVAARLAGVANCEVVADDAPETIAAALERVLRTGERSTGRHAVRELDENVIARGVIGVYRKVLGRDRAAEPAGGAGVDTAGGPAA